MAFSPQVQRLIIEGIERATLALDPEPESFIAAFARYGVRLEGADGLTLRGTATATGVLPEWLLLLAGWHQQEIAAYLEEHGTDGIRCPHCKKKLGNRLAGTYETTCPRCKQMVSITR